MTVRPRTLTLPRARAIVRAATPDTIAKVSAVALSRIAAPLVALATMVVIVAAAVAVFFNPLWVAFEQDRTGAPALLGYATDDVRAATASILGEFCFGPGTFAVEVNGEPVLNPRERQHMADVRGVVLAFAALAIGSILVLLLAARSRRPRTWAWQAVAVGSGLLAGGVVIAGVLAALFFEQAFEVFHRLLFPAGSYSFDPTSERLVQLFPMQFWNETSIALAVVLLTFSLIVAAVALRRLPAELPGVDASAIPRATGRCAAS